MIFAGQEDMYWPVAGGWGEEDDDDDEDEEEKKRLFVQNLFLGKMTSHFSLLGTNHYALSSPLPPPQKNPQSSR